MVYLRTAAESIIARSWGGMVRTMISYQLMEGCRPRIRPNGEFGLILATAGSETAPSAASRVVPGLTAVTAAWPVTTETDEVGDTWRRRRMDDTTEGEEGERSDRMTPQQAHVLTSFCSRYPTNTLGLLDVLLAAAESAAALVELAPEVAAKEGTYPMRQCLVSRSKHHLSECSRALARGLPLSKVPGETRKELNKLWRVINKTVKSNVGKEGVLELPAPPPKWLAHTQQGRAHAVAQLLSEPKDPDRKEAGGRKRAAAGRESTGDVDGHPVAVSSEGERVTKMRPQEVPIGCAHAGNNLLQGPSVKARRPATGSGKAAARREDPGAATGDCLMEVCPEAGREPERRGKQTSPGLLKRAGQKAVWDRSGHGRQMGCRSAGDTTPPLEEDELESDQELREHPEEMDGRDGHEQGPPRKRTCTLSSLALTAPPPRALPNAGSAGQTSQGAGGVGSSPSAQIPQPCASGGGGRPAGTRSHPQRKAAEPEAPLKLEECPVGCEVLVPREGMSQAFTWCRVVSHVEGQLRVRVHDPGDGSDELLKVSLRLLDRNKGREGVRLGEGEIEVGERRLTVYNPPVPTAVGQVVQLHRMDSHERNRWWRVVRRVGEGQLEVRALDERSAEPARVEVVDVMSVRCSRETTPQESKSNLMRLRNIVPGLAGWTGDKKVALVDAIQRATTHGGRSLTFKNVELMCPANFPRLLLGHLAQALVLQRSEVQVLNVKALDYEGRLLDNTSFEALLTLLKMGHVWALNLGETELSSEQVPRLLETVNASAVAFLFLESKYLSSDWIRRFENVLKAKWQTKKAPWLIDYSVDESDQILAVRKAQETANLWFGPMSLGRNKGAERDARAAVKASREARGEGSQKELEAKVTLEKLATVGDGVRIAPSTLGRAAGRGLFVDRPVQKGEYVTEYAGKVMSSRAHAASERVHTHIAIAKRSKVRGTPSNPDRMGEDLIVAGDTRVKLGRGGGQFANHPNEGKGNVELVIAEDKIVLQALRDLRPGEEVFLWCGHAEYAHRMMMGFTRLTEEGGVEVACSRCATDPECDSAWETWSTFSPTGGWRTGDDKARRADKLIASVREFLTTDALAIVDGWKEGGDAETASVLERARSYIPSVKIPTRTNPVTAAKLVLKDPADDTLQAWDEVAAWGLETMLDGADDDAVYLLGRMRDVQRISYRHERAKVAAIRALFHRDNLPTGMASESGHWMRVRGGRALSATARRKAMGWGDSESMLAYAAKASELSETQVCALELQAVHGAPAAAIARMTEWILSYHPVHPDWEGTEGTFALLGSGGGFFGLPWVDAIEAQGWEPREVLYAECMDNAAAYHDAIFSSLGMNPTRFNWAHGPALLQSGLRARRVLASLCCGWVSPASRQFPDDVHTALVIHAAMMKVICQTLQPDVIWIETSAGILAKDREDARTAYEALIALDPRWEWRRLRLNPKEHFGYPVERDRVFYGGFRKRTASWPSNQALFERMKADMGDFDIVSLTPAGVDKTRGAPSMASRTSGRVPTTSSFARMKAEREAELSREGTVVFDFRDPALNQTAGLWMHDTLHPQGVREEWRQREDGYFEREDEHVNAHQPFEGEVCLAPLGEDYGRESGSGDLPWPEGDELMTFDAADQVELGQDAARLRYEKRARGREPGAPLLPQMASAREEEGDEAGRRLRRGEADHDDGRYPIKEVLEIERENQLPALKAAAKDAKRAAGTKGGKEGKGGAPKDPMKEVVKKLIDQLKRPRGWDAGGPSSSGDVPAATGK